MMSPKTKKANESLSSAALFGREKISHSPVCDSIFLCLLGQKFDDMSSRPTKILKISAFRDFFVTEPKCQKGAKNRVKTRFLRRISILCSSYGGSDGNLNRNVRFRQCVAFRSTIAHSFRRLSMAVRPSFSAAEWVRYLQKVPPQRRGPALCTDPLLCGGSDGNRTHVRKPLDTTFFVGSLFFILPVRRREQTRFSSR